MRTIVAITGASGAKVAVDFLKKCPGEKFLVISRWGKAVLHQETGLSSNDLLPYVSKVFSNDDLNAPFASGSVSFDQFVIAPCSMTTLARISMGLSENLICRIGEVALKENRKMLLALRETPLSPIALENSLKLSRLGVTIMPITPQFYFRPESVDDMVSRFVDHMLVTLKLTPTELGWRESEIRP